MFLLDMKTRLDKRFGLCLDYVKSNCFGQISYSPLIPGKAEHCHQCGLLPLPLPALHAHARQV